MATTSLRHSAEHNVTETSESRKLSSSTDAGPQEIHQTLPVGVAVKKAPYGHGIFATQFFPKGAVVYVGRQIVIPNEYAEFRLILDGTDQTFLLNTDTHSVQFSENKRWLYLFDSFMNHSCSPSTISRQTETQRENNAYDTVALRDLHPGDQITCDYNLFEYDCHGKIIERCMCGSECCIGRVAGFKYLSRPAMKSRIDLVDVEVLDSLSSDPENKFYYIPDLKCPMDRVAIVTVDDDSYKMIAQRDFECGEIVYANKSLIFSEDCAIVIEINGKRKWLNNLIHTVNRGKGRREFYYFDSFQNHSCEPNTEMRYHTENTYDLVATRNIIKGEELTSDYESFDVGLDGTSFQCACGANKCRKIVNA